MLTIVVEYRSTEKKMDERITALTFNHLPKKKEAKNSECL